MRWTAKAGFFDLAGPSKNPAFAVRRRASYVDVGLLESLGLIGLPDHVALGGVGIEAHPSLKLIVGRRHVLGFFGDSVD
jgi:hypothetical protein